MLNPIPALVFILLTALGILLFGRSAEDYQNLTNLLIMGGFATVGAVIASGIKVAAQWEKALIFRLGKFLKTAGPGLFWARPFFDSVRMVDTRIFTLDIPTQQAITKDNVPVSLDGVIFLKVESPQDAVIRVQHFQHAIRQYAQTALRDVIGALTLDDILADRESVGKQIEQMVEHETEGWGLEVAGIRIQDIVLPEDLKRVMARQAAAEREKRANITKSEGDREAAANLAAAASTMATSPGALQLRTLQTLDSLGSSAANTVVLAVPVEVMSALDSVSKVAKVVTTTQAKKDAKEEELDRQRLAASAPKAVEEQSQSAELKNQT